MAPQLAPRRSGLPVPDCSSRPVLYAASAATAVADPAWPRRSCGKAQPRAACICWNVFSSGPRSGKRCRSPAVRPGSADCCRCAQRNALPWSGHHTRQKGSISARPAWRVRGLAHHSPLHHKTRNGKREILVSERSDARRTSKQLFSGLQVYLAHRYRATWVARRCCGQEMLPPKSRAERQR